ncbi:PQQ-binding-like beta-propeller repeat protein [Streptomyces olivaceiscleroticus]|uniref:Pyrrolo-quinoline quinone repeat domain-containing protein n=1 Tax=Streptomyces olivaceiscleroticus TaxID=68245 RepID=A0ABP3JGE7_9ACTN
MVRKRARIVWSAGCGIVLTLGLLALLIGDHGRKDKPPGRPNALTVAWSFLAPGRASDTVDVAPAVSDRMLAIPQGRTLSVVNTRNGHLLSTVRSSDEFQEVGLSGNVVLAVPRKDLGLQWRYDSLHGYDPATGRELWNTGDGDGGQIAQSGGGVFRGGMPVLAPDPGPVVEAAGDRLMGLAPRTGKERWTKRMPVPARCARSEPDTSASPVYPYEVAATRKYVILLSSCPGTAVELDAVNPESGDIVWHKRLGRWDASLALVAARNAIGVRKDGEFRLFTESGEEVPRRKGDRRSDGWPLGEAHGVMYLAETHSSDGQQADTSHAAQKDSVRAVRVDTGKPVWTRSAPSWFGGRELGRGIITGGVHTGGAYDGDTRWSVGDARSQGPGASNLMDFAGRTGSRVPWPVAGTFVGMSGELLIIRSEEKNGTRYTALRPGHRVTDEESPVALGGAKRKDWPHACGLLSADFLAELARGYVKVPVKGSRTVLGTQLPHPSGCRFATASGPDSDIFTVTVRWVAPDAKAARTYAASAVPWGGSPASGGRITAAVTEPQRGLYLYTYRTGLAQKPIADATVVSGRYVFGVGSVSDEARAERLVRRVAQHLSQHAGPGHTP